MTRNRTIAAQIVLIMALSIAAFALGTSRAHATVPPPSDVVSLWDAVQPPSELSVVWPGESHTYARGREGWNCSHHAWFTDVQAYRWNGQALGRQQWNDRTQVIFWRDKRGGRVTFDGITFRNRTHHPVQVAGWCAADAWTAN
jgi:hypothetical protein